MTSLTGWIKLHRKTLESPVWNLSDAQLRVWLTCLLMANNTNRKWFDGTSEVEIPRGSFITSEPKLAKEARVSRIVVRRALSNLEVLGSFRAKKRAKRYTMIEIVNFDIYQGSEEIESQQMSLRRAKDEPRTSHATYDSPCVDQGSHASFLGF